MLLRILTWITDKFTHSEPAEQSAGLTVHYSIPVHKNSFDSEEFLPKTDKQILIDSTAITEMLIDAGYEPIESLSLLAKIFGATVGTMPDNMRDQNGTPLTQQDVETNFFFACRTDRKIVNEKRYENAIRAKRLH